MASKMALRSPLSLFAANVVSPLFSVGGIRLKAHKTSATSRNKRKNTPGKSRGYKRQDGQFVHSGEVLVTQLGLRFYPGENVRLGRNNTLYAMTDGKVVVTCEKLAPFPNSPLYEPVENGLVVYKKFFNILSTPLYGKFRLVSQV